MIIKQYALRCDTDHCMETLGGFKTIAEGKYFAKSKGWYIKGNSCLCDECHHKKKRLQNYIKDQKLKILKK